MELQPQSQSQSHDNIFVRIGNALFAIKHIGSVVRDADTFIINIPGHFWYYHKKYLTKHFVFEDVQNALTNSIEPNDLVFFPEYIRLKIKSDETADLVATKHIVAIWIHPGNQYTVYFNSDQVPYCSVRIAQSDTKAKFDLYTYLYKSFPYDLDMADTGEDDPPIVEESYLPMLLYCGSTLIIVLGLKLLFVK